MKRLYIIALLTLLLAGCTAPARVQVTNTSSGEPVPLTAVQRHVSTGVSVAPLGPVQALPPSEESYWTDSDGYLSFSRIEPNDTFSLLTTSSVPLTVTIGTESIMLDPGATDYGVWSYSFRKINGKWQTYVGMPTLTRNKD